MEARSFRFAAAALLIAARAGMAYAADAVAPAGSAPPAAYTVAPSGPDMVTLNFVNADIEGVVKAVGEITGKNFVIDPRVKGTINIISSQPMSRALVYEVFLAALRLQGFAAVEDRGLVKILPEADAKLHRGSAQRGVGDEIQTRIFNLKYESAAQMVTILRPLISPNNSITPAQSSNSLIITDYAGNLERIARIIGGLDRPTGTDPIDIPLHNASALDVAATINRLFAEAGAPAAAEPALHFVIIPDARSNSILVRSADPSRLAQIRQLADMLDSRTSAGGNIHVVYLKNAEAVKIAETLRAIYSARAAPCVRCNRRRCRPSAPARWPPPRRCRGSRPRAWARKRRCRRSLRRRAWARRASSRPTPPPTPSSSPRPTRSTTTCAPPSKSSTCAAPRCMSRR